MSAPRPPSQPGNALPEPSDKQREAIARATERVHKRSVRVAARIALKRKQGPPSLEVAPSHTDSVGWCNQIKDAFGTCSPDFAAMEMDRLANTLACVTKAGVSHVQTATNAALAAMAAAQPKDEIEAMLASQMAATHALVMDLLGRTKRAEYQPQFEMAGNMAIKLLRTYVLQTEVLAKMRRGGEQTVRVEHVHVYPGGQAVVGNVADRAGTGGGGSNENVGQPHAIGHSSSSPMWGAHTQTDAVSATRNGKGPLPHARRCEG